MTKLNQQMRIKLNQTKKLKE